MNRKLVNGLLLLSIATVGCGTFTSCKDTDDDVQAGYNKELASIYKDLLDKINNIKSCDCDPNIAANLDAIAQWLGATKTDGKWVLPEGGLDKAITDKIDEVYLDNLAEALKTENYDLIVPALQNLQGQFNKQITSIELNQTYNPVFGTLNLPTGLQTNVLAAYYGVSDKEFKFPDFSDEMNGHEVGIDEAEMVKVNALCEAANLNPATVTVPAGVYMDQNGFLGNAYLTINPINNGLAYDLELIKSTGDAAPVKLATAASDDELKFGYTRANNGLYKAVATINPADASKIAIALKPEFKSAVVDILKNPSKATLTQLGAALLSQMNGILPAYGFRAPFDAASFSYTVDEEGMWTIKEENPLMNAIVSKYELAATTIHPLGYNSLKDLTISKRLPTFSPISEALDDVFENIKNDAQFNFANPENLKWEFNENDMKITIDLTDVLNQDAIADGANPVITLGYKNGQVHQEGDNTTALNPLVDQIIAQVNKKLIDIQNNINDKVENIIESIQNQLGGKVDVAQKLLDKYNALANKINAYLEDPHEHMQVAMAYEGSDGALHMLSTQKAAPSRFSMAAGGDAIKLLATSYTGDVAAPSYKKYVAVVEAPNGNVAAVNDKSSSLNTVLSGRQHIVDMTGFQKGNYTIVYSSVDYRGNTSTRLYYLEVVD